ncbi:hypothetical protein Dda_4544 [Drechslerella dactyloides]|uniref:Uncharacterized protein n=1 Tax=Drechslerella dactyloides TaxID=74499 RepID=A0AAD6NJ76_DREDA|nr:hypothetical protein Dda_4544 [Drechslerella dactyloides]
MRLSLPVAPEKHAHALILYTVIPLLLFTSLLLVHYTSYTSTPATADEKTHSRAWVNGTKHTPLSSPEPPKADIDAPSTPKLQPSAPTSRHPGFRRLKRTEPLLGAYVKCATVDQVIHSMNPDPLNYTSVLARVPGGGLRRMRRPSFRYRWDDAADAPDEQQRDALRWLQEEYAKEAIEECEECECDDNRNIVVPVINWWSQCTREHAQTCGDWYRCACMLRVDDDPELQKKADPEPVPALRVIDSLALVRKARQQAKLCAAEACGDSGQGSSQPAPVAVYKTEVGGTREPYYLEGPSKGVTWDWMRSPLLGFNYGASWAAFVSNSMFNRAHGRLRGRPGPALITKREADADN